MFLRPFRPLNANLRWMVSAIFPSKMNSAVTLYPISSVSYTNIRFELKKKTSRQHTKRWWCTPHDSTKSLSNRRISFIHPSTRILHKTIETIPPNARIQVIRRTQLAESLYFCESTNSSFRVHNSQKVTEKLQRKWIRKQKKRKKKSNSKTQTQTSWTKFNENTQNETMKRPPECFDAFIVTEIK